MATLTPIIVLVDDTTVAALGPMVARLMERWDVKRPPELDAAMHRLMAINGWTYEMLAWGNLLHAVAVGIDSNRIEVRDSDE